ncbi:MAG: thioredoxin domain-containing protein [Methyloprofundus sp.]|nr:thioredoxin domain-containing protein [Methyloprofundus sp.]
MSNNTSLLSKLNLINGFITLVLLLVLIFLFVKQSYVQDSNKEQQSQIIQELKKINLALNKNTRQNTRQKVVPQSVKPNPFFAPSRGKQSLAKNATFFKVSLDSAYSIGQKSAPITMVEYVNYQCVYCKKFHIESFPALKTEFIDKGLVRLVIKDLVSETRPESLALSNAVHCAAEQGKFAEMHKEMLFNPQSLLNNNAASLLAKKIGLNSNRLTQCIKKGRYNADIKKSSANTKKMGIANTPTFIIGRSKGKEVHGEKIEGARPFNFFKNKIESLLAKQ